MTPRLGARERRGCSPRGCPALPVLLLVGFAPVKRPFSGPNLGFSLMGWDPPFPNVVVFLCRRLHRPRIWLCGAPWPWLAAAGGPPLLRGPVLFLPAKLSQCGPDTGQGMGSGTAGAENLPFLGPARVHGAP